VSPRILLIALVLLLGAPKVLAQPAAALDAARYPQLVHSKPFRRWWHEFRPRAYPLAAIPDGARLRAMEQLIRQRAAARVRGLQAPPAEVWVSIGPAPISGNVLRAASGRVTSVAIDPTNASHWLIGAAQGGVWDTFDAGGTWTPRTDGEASLAMGAIAIAPSNTDVIYAATGEASFSGDSYGGAGVLKSTDAGAHWTLLATSTFRHAVAAAIAVDPTNPSIVLVATSFGIAGRGPVLVPAATGVFKSIDGGVSWSERLSGGATDLAVDPTSFDRQYAAIGQGFGAGVYRSLNAGDTFVAVPGPWDGAANGFGRAALAIAPSDPNVVYVGVQDAFNGVGNDGELLGLWRSSNAWAATPTWTAIPAIATDTGLRGYCEEICWYANVLSVDPADADVLYAGGRLLWRYDGVAWTDLGRSDFVFDGGIHVDQHALAWAGNRLLVGNDGGVWSTADGGATWADHNTNLAITQFYDGAPDPLSANVALGGNQDNGTARWTGAATWQLVGFGDGGGSVISSSAPATAWAVTSEDLVIARTQDGGLTYIAADDGIDKTGVPFIARIERCPGNEDVVIAGTDNLWKSTSFFTAAVPSWNANGPEMAENITALAFAASDATCGTYAFATASGAIRLTSDGGATWTDIDEDDAVPDRYVTDLAFDPTNANVLYVALSGFDEGTPGEPGHVFTTMNALAPLPSWSNVTPPVNIPCNTVAVDPLTTTTVYVGTDLGVWRSTEAGASWTDLGSPAGLPNVAIFDLQFEAVTDRPVAFTHGRSAFRLTAGEIPTPTVTAPSTPTPTITSPTPMVTPFAGGVAARKCRAAIIGAAAVLVDTEAKAESACARKIVAGRLPRGTACRSEAKTAALIDRARAKLSNAVVKACGGTDKVCGSGDDVPLAAVGWAIGSCPNFAGGACTNEITDCVGVVTCVTCVGETAVDQAISLVFDDLTPTDPRNRAERRLNKCQATIGGAATTFLVTKSKALQKCWRAVVGGKASGTCPAADGRGAKAIAKAESKMVATICRACGGADKACDDSADFSAMEIGFPTTCPDVGASGAGSCGHPVTSLQDLVTCADCLTEFAVDCADRSAVPGLAAYPPGCNP